MVTEGLVVSLEEQAALVKKTAAAAASWSSSKSWAVLDKTGSSQVVDLDKHAILRRVGIDARDLRILDPFLSCPSAILGRERAIVINLEHVKAIITADEVLLRDPSDDNVVPVVQELQRRLTAAALDAINSGVHPEDDQDLFLQTDLHSSEENEFPFEFCALEVILEGICSFLDARTKELENAAYPALDELTSEVSGRTLDKVRKLKSAMTRLTNRVQKVRDELEQLLDDDSDMQELYLSRKPTGSASPPNGLEAPESPTTGSKISRASRASTAITNQDENDVDELEMLLEAYFLQIETSLNKLTTLRDYIDNTEDYINIQLDNHRNQLIQLELCLNSATLGLSIYSLVAGIFGMNIPFTWNDGHSYVFKWVVILSGVASGLLFLCVMIYARHKGLILMGS